MLVLPHISINHANCMQQYLKFTTNLKLVAFANADFLKALVSKTFCNLQVQFHYQPLFCFCDFNHYLLTAQLPEKMQKGQYPNCDFAYHNLDYYTKLCCYHTYVYVSTYKNQNYYSNFGNIFYCCLLKDYFKRYCLGWLLVLYHISSSNCRWHHHFA